MMTERGSLPLFVREALEPDAGDVIVRHLATDHSASNVGNAQASPDLAIDAERGFLALERALDAEAATDRGGAAGVPELDPVLARLAQAISEAPHRYAPFYARAAELFDLTEEAVIQELGRLRNPGVWNFAGLPGISHASVPGGPRVQSAETLFVRLKPGVYFPRHQHTGVERVLVLEGSYQDSHGIVHRPGELREWAPGTDHSFKIGGGEPCIFASVVFGRRFSAWPLRVLSTLLGR
jgi:anti-sigma factor ChrR (cupin superfamily)